MSVAPLAVKAFLALVLLLAGAAKLADRRDVASTVGLFLPTATPGRLVVAIATASGLVELGTGGASLVFPEARAVDLVVLGLTCAFVATSVSGHALHPGATCNCFGRLSGRTFGVAGIVRSVALAGLALLVVNFMPGSGDVRATTPSVILLVVGSGLVACATFTAAANLATASTRQAVQGRR